MLIYNDNDGLFTVYLITNKINNKKYIGVHKEQPGEDLYAYMGSGTSITAAIQKYGVENFDKVILARFDNPTDAKQMEADLVRQEIVESKEYYNLQTGGDYGIPSQETREKMSAANKGKPKSKEHRENISAAKKSMSEETREKIRASNRRRPVSEETREKMSAANTGKKRGPISEETRAKISATKKGKPMSEEHREKISAANKGKPKGLRSKEHRENISAAMKGNSLRKGKPLSKEHREKISAARKGLVRHRKNNA